MRHFSTLLLGVALLVGCQNREEEHGEKRSEFAENAPSYKEGKGLFIGAITKESIDLKTVAVSQKQIAPQFTMEIQVYQNANKTNAVLASGFVSPIDASHLKIGQEAKLKSEKRNLEITGKLVRLDEQSKTFTGQVEAIVSVPDSEGKLSSGDSLLCTFQTGEPKASITIPRSALVESSEGNFVYLENGEFFARADVKPGATINGSVVILDGLAVGDVVVANGSQWLWLAELRITTSGGHAH
jgi:multidrug efflux pump subunit AcrA (membrane-fusion protein)